MQMLCRRYHRQRVSVRYLAILGLNRFWSGKSNVAYEFFHDAKGDACQKYPVLLYIIRWATYREMFTLLIRFAAVATF